MEKTKETNESNQTFGEEKRMGDEREELLKSLPKEKTPDGIELCFYEGYWYPSHFMHGIISFQQGFIAQDADLLIVTLPKSGTTWLKALSFAIANRKKYTPSQTPLLTTNSHVLVPFLDNAIYGKKPFVKLQDIANPRILATHVPYSALPASIRNSACRVVYLCRNPLDQFISISHYVAKILNRTFDPSLIEDAFDMFCQGMTVYGPFWDHVLGYWKASQERPDKVLFLKYEDMKEDTISQLKVLAKFMGFPFSVEEESQGVIEEVLKLCSFESMKDLDVNKNDKNFVGHPNSAYFRKGEVGDWVNYLTVSMVERMKKIMEEKLTGSGLNFKFS